MNKSVKKLLMAMPFYHAIRNVSVRRKQARELASWQANGRQAPSPHLVKQRVLREMAAENGLTVLVETGTYYGDMVEAMRSHFEKVYSIELSSELYERARRRFRGAGNVELLCGDSGVELGKIVARLDRAALFWLDGHYSAGVTAKGVKDTPIYEELDHILSARDLGHVIIIDDARCFGVDADYPTLEELKAYVLARRPNLAITVQDDSIRIVPVRR
jgi:hypothetical protein